MPEQPFIPPPRKPVAEYPVPDHSVAFYTELVNRDDPAYIANSPVKRGSLYSTMVGAKREVIAQYPELFFLRERKFQLNDQLVLWDWATDEDAHDTYNADITYIANAVAYPAFTRVYTIRRELYEASPTVAIGSLLPGIVAVAIDSPGQNYTKATGVIDNTSVAIQFTVSPNGGLLAGVITNTGEELIPNGTPITIIGDGQDGEAVAVSQPVGCVLTAQKKEELPPDSPTGHELVKVTRVYETLPGPWIVSKRIDKDGAIITAKTRRQISDFIVDKDEISNGDWIQTIHKGTDNFVSDETVETRPLPGNPIITAKPDEDGMVITTTKTLVDASTVVASETLITGVWTRTSKEELSSTTFVKDTSSSEKVCWQVSEARPIPGNPIPSTQLDKDGETLDVARTMKDATLITTEEQVIAGVWIRTESERITDLVSWEVVKARAVPGDPIPSANVPADHEVALIETTIKEASTITPVASESGGIIHTVEQREVSELVSEEVITDKEFLDEALYSVAIPNVIPELFRAFIPVNVESHILAGTAAPPVLGAGEFERSEKQITKLLFERRTTLLASVSIPFTFCGFKDTNQYKQIVTSCYTLEDDSVVPPVPTALCDVEVIILGNGMQVVITKCVPNIYEALSYSERKPDVTPEIFKATIPLDTVSEIVAGSPAPPTLGSGEYEASEREVTEFTKETSLTSRDLTVLPATVISYETNRDKQVVTVDQTLETDPTVPATPDALTDVTYKPLGDGTAVEEVRTIPEVFSGQVYEKEIPDVVPVEFRVAIPTETTEVSQAGTAADPTLGAGDLQKRETQTDTFVKRVAHRFRSLVGIPISLVSYATSRVKQLVTITRTLKLAGAPTPPTATTDVETQNLGDGTVVETVSEVPDVFGEESFRRTRPDVTPPEFRALLQTDTQSSVTAGNATDPTLGIGELDKSSEQITEFTKRDSTTARDLTSIPQTLVDTDTDKDKQVETISKTLELSGTSTAAPDATTSVSVIQLGDGTEVEKVVTVPEVFGREEFGKDRPEVTPLKFRALIPAATTALDSAGAAVAPVLAAGDIEKRSQQVDEFVKRDSTRTRSAASLPQTIVGKDTSNVKQVVTVTEILESDATVPAVPTATQTVTFDKLGDGTAVETRRSVPDVFGRAEYSTRIPDVVPVEFRVAVPTTTTALDAAGTAAAPTLGVGDLQKTEQQVDEFVKRSTTEHRSTVTYPISLPSSKLTPEGQVETINQVLDVGLQTVTGSATTLESDVRNLGDGTSLKTEGTVPDVFNHGIYTKEIPDLIPVEFRPFVPTTTTAETSAGTASTNPTLGTGDLRKTEEQSTEFRKRITTEGRGSIALPIAHTNYELTTEFGGGQLNMTKTLEDSGTGTLDEGLLVTKSSITDLGNGTELKQTDELNGVEWPILVGTEVDPRTGIVVSVTKQVVPAGTTGGVGVDGYVDVKSLDKWRSITIASKLDPSTLPTPVSWETTSGYSFPNTLQGCQFLWASAATATNFAFDAFLQTDILAGYNGPCRALITETFSDGPPGDVVTVTQFFPQSRSIGFAWAFANGDSNAVRADARTFNLPEVINDEILLNIGVVFDDGSYTNSIPATTPTALPASGTLIVKEVDVERWRFGIFFRRVTEIYVP